MYLASFTCYPRGWDTYRCSHWLDLVVEIACRWRGSTRVEPGWGGHLAPLLARGLLSQSSIPRGRTEPIPNFAFLLGDHIWTTRSSYVTSKTSFTSRRQARGLTMQCLTRMNNKDAKIW